MIDDLPDPGPIEEKKILAKMARVTRMARTVARMARWLADLDDPFNVVLKQPIFSRKSIFSLPD